MFVLYKKYDNSYIATQVSWWGFLLVLCCGVGVGMAVYSTLESTIGTVIGIITGIAVFVLLKILLNKLTDNIANKASEKQALQAQEMSISDNCPLRIPASLSIVRDSNFVAALVPTMIFHNDVQVASIKNGESVTIPIIMKYNLIRTNTADVNGNPPKGTWYKFEARDGIKGTIHVSAGVFKTNSATWE